MSPGRGHGMSCSLVEAGIPPVSTWPCSEICFMDALSIQRSMASGLGVQSSDLRERCHIVTFHSPILMLTGYTERYSSI